MKLETVGFVGLGLIGGSIAKAIKAFHPKIQIMAYMRTADTLIEAANEGTVDIVCTAVDGQFRACDCIFLCAPVSTNARYLEALKPVIREDCILTDVGSTKTDIHERVTALDLEGHFIGGHPMAGSEKTGYANAKAHLIENAYYIITPAAKVPKETTDLFVAFIASLKALPLVLDYRQHDFITAAVSHLPHLIASSLVNLVQDLDGEDALMKRIAAGGFKDITRIASSSPEMWEQICMTNKENLIKVLDCYLQQLTAVKKQLEEQESEKLHRFFETSRDYRNSIPDSSLGPIKKMYAFYCDMVDEAGGIAALATILAAGGISLKNIGIIHNREFEEAVLKVELYDEASYEKAVALLRKYRYTIYER
ncbi:MAG: prephenate dehydrogenase [Lachnospiraceae bacterium]|jgi:prephenate dehydrogenase|nr:prephenate dehydrogenase [Lachnospiraceae bacterium]